MLQAIFQRLIEDDFCDLVPSILITAKGMPDMATRVMLWHLHAAMPQLPVLGLVDWNPSGICTTLVHAIAIFTDVVFATLLLKHRTCAEWHDRGGDIGMLQIW